MHATAADVRHRAAPLKGIQCVSSPLLPTAQAPSRPLSTPHDAQAGATLPRLDGAAADATTTTTERDAEAAIARQDNRKDKAVAEDRKARTLPVVPTTRRGFLATLSSTLTQRNAYSRLGSTTHASWALTQPLPPPSSSSTRSLEPPLVTALRRYIDKEVRESVNNTTTTTTTTCNGTSAVTATTTTTTTAAADETLCETPLRLVGAETCTAEGSGGGDRAATATTTVVGRTGLSHSASVRSALVHLRPHREAFVALTAALPGYEVLLSDIRTAYEQVLHAQAELIDDAYMQLEQRGRHRRAATRHTDRGDDDDDDDEEERDDAGESEHVQWLQTQVARLQAQLDAVTAAAAAAVTGAAASPQTSTSSSSSTTRMLSHAAPRHHHAQPPRRRHRHRRTTSSSVSSQSLSSSSSLLSTTSQPTRPPHDTHVLSSSAAAALAVTATTTTTTAPTVVAHVARGDYLELRRQLEEAHQRIAALELASKADLERILVLIGAVREADRRMKAFEQTVQRMSGQIDELDEFKRLAGEAQTELQRYKERYHAYVSSSDFELMKQHLTQELAVAQSVARRMRRTAAVRGTQVDVMGRRVQLLEMRCAQLQPTDRGSGGNSASLHSSSSASNSSITAATTMTTTLRSTSPTTRDDAQHAVVLTPRPDWSAAHRALAALREHARDIHCAPLQHDANATAATAAPPEDEDGAVTSPSSRAGAAAATTAATTGAANSSTPSHEVLVVAGPRETALQVEFLVQHMREVYAQLERVTRDCREAQWAWQQCRALHPHATAVIAAHASHTLGKQPSAAAAMVATEATAANITTTASDAVPAAAATATTSTTAASGTSPLVAREEWRGALDTAVDAASSGAILLAPGYGHYTSPHLRACGVVARVVMDRKTRTRLVFEFFVSVLQPLFAQPYSSETSMSELFDTYLYTKLMRSRSHHTAGLSSNSNNNNNTGASSAAAARTMGTSASGYGAGGGNSSTTMSVANTSTSRNASRTHRQQQQQHGNNNRATAATTTNSGTKGGTVRSLDDECDLSMYTSVAHIALNLEADAIDATLVDAPLRLLHHILHGRMPVRLAVDAVAMLSHVMADLDALAREQQKARLRRQAISECLAPVLELLTSDELRQLRAALGNDTTFDVLVLSSIDSRFMSTLFTLSCQGTMDMYVRLVCALCAKAQPLTRKPRSDSHYNDDVIALDDVKAAILAVEPATPAVVVREISEHALETPVEDDAVNTGQGANTTSSTRAVTGSTAASARTQQSPRVYLSDILGAVNEAPIIRRTPTLTREQCSL